MLGKVYFASPFFKEDQIEREERCKSKLRDLGFDVFSPRDSFVLKPDATDEERDMVFKENIKNIDECDIFFGVTDYKDMGTLTECGIVQGMNFKDSKKRKIVYYAETLPPGASFNVMLSKPADVVITKFEDLDKLPEWLESGHKYEGNVQ